MGVSFNRTWLLSSIVILFVILSVPTPVYAETVTLQLKWTHQFQFAGYYAAVEQGFYQAEGLHVILKEGRPSMNLIQEVTDGNAAFGVDNNSLLLERSNGAPIRVVAAVFQHSPQVLIARKDSGIVSPHDLIGKRVMLVPEQSTDILAMLINEGIDPQQVHLQPHTWNINDLIEGKTDAMTGYATTEPFLLQTKNVPVNILNPINYGIDYYGDCLFTTENLIKTQPDLVERFVRASLKGWEYAMAHQDEIIDLIILKYNPALTSAQLHYEANELNKIILPDYVELGHMNPGRWAKIVETHQKSGLLKDTFSIEKFIYIPDENGGYPNNQALIVPLLSVIGVLTFGLIVFIVFNTRLKRIVKERTEKLEEKVRELQEKEKTILHLAYHDTLTKLPNRLMLIELVDINIDLERELGGHFAIAFLDLDDFKRINDAMGHSAGDEFLKVVAQRLQHCLQTRGLVCRLGGDEFILLLTRTGGYEQITGIVRSAIAEINSPWNFKGGDFHISASVGVSVYPDDGQDADSLIKAADMAMYEAKRNGKNRYQFFSQEMHAASLERLALESDLHQAIAQSEFVLHYQPQFDYNSRIIGVETLIRWQHPGRGLLHPGAFIPFAEETGLIVPIGDWIIHSACRQCANWQYDSKTPLRVSVNVSVKQLQHPDFLKTVRKSLEETGLPPHLLELEITETIAVTHTELVLPLMNSLRDMGVRLALDDFGTGYSSLMYLKDFPIDVLKIDKAFIQDVPINTDNEAILQTILDLARNLRISAVAEGVETMDQFNCLKKYSCPIVQGYLFSPPIPAQEIDKFLTPPAKENTACAEA